MEGQSYNGNQKHDIGFQYCQESYENNYGSQNMQMVSPNYVPYLTMVQQPMYYQQPYPVYQQEPYSTNAGPPMSNDGCGYDAHAYTSDDPRSLEYVGHPQVQYYSGGKSAASQMLRQVKQASMQHKDDGCPKNVKDYHFNSSQYDNLRKDDDNVPLDTHKVYISDNQAYNQKPSRGKSNYSRGGYSRGRSNYNQDFRNMAPLRGGGNPRRAAENWHGNRYQNQGQPQHMNHHSKPVNGNHTQPNYSNERYNNYKYVKRGSNSYASESKDAFNRGRHVNKHFNQGYSGESVQYERRPPRWKMEERSAKDNFNSYEGLAKSELKTVSTINNETKLDKKDRKSLGDLKSSKASWSFNEDDEKMHKDKLVELLTQGTYECMVCCENVKQPQPIWSCTMCYHCFHLRCTKKWAEISHEEEGWRCPACQNTSTKLPNTYFCFCRKMRNPEWNRREIPHSCGEVCGKKRGPDWCVHKCNVLCHPGPCPPCSAFMTRVCPCGKSSRSVRCSQIQTFICTKVCQKPLNCKKHTCDQVCHEGECEPCQQHINKCCHCGKEEKSVPCTEEELLDVNYSCGVICGRKLNCDNHNCEKICHEGPCISCEKSVEAVITCPCTKALLGSLYENNKIVPRVACTDPIPTCGEICGKGLKCGTPGSYHECRSLCHEGPCPPCSLETSIRCRCGSKDCKMPCNELFVKADEVLCEKQCKKLRQCGRHKCGVKCCIDQDHTCPRICGRHLKCRLHKCEEPCHRGNCPRCWQTSFEELTCHCGAAVLFPPIACGTEALACDKPCQRPQPCKHLVAHSCHMDDNCPPCTELVGKLCFGSHVLMKITPCYVKAISCGELCDKILPCSTHKCQKVCHDGPCLEGNKCIQKCTKSRPMCEHSCANPCHEGPCPDTPCKVNVAVTCSCGNRKATIVCTENEREYRAMATSRLASMMQNNMSSGGSVDISQIFSGANKAERFQRLECNDECHLIARNQRLALALQITNPETRERLGDQSGMFSDTLKDDVKKDQQFCSMVHSALHDLVMKAKESKQKSRSHSFAPMNKEKRRFIHEYAKHFGCQTQAYDEEPKKNVVVTATRGLCYLPPVSVMEVVQKEQGKRKAPGPVLNRKTTSKADILPQLQKLEKKNTKPKTSAAAVASVSCIDYFDLE